MKEKLIQFFGEMKYILNLWFCHQIKINLSTNFIFYIKYYNYKAEIIIIKIKLTYSQLLVEFCFEDDEGNT